MKKSLGIQPFKEFYMNCSMNNYFSVLITLDESFKIAPYINSYRYSTFEFDDNTLKFPGIDYRNSYRDLFQRNLIYYENYFFRDSNNFINEIKEIIVSGKPVLLFIDLYNWIPTSLAWQKHHWNHFSLIVGFDEDERVFYAIDDDANGVDIREIPEERLIESFWGTGFFVDYDFFPKPDIASPCITINHKENIEPYKLEIEQVANNIQVMLQDIDLLNPESYWEFIPSPHHDLDELSDHAIAGLNIIYNRQIGNRFLLNELFKENFISKNYYESLFNIINVIVGEWNKAKNILKKAKYLDKLSTVRISLIAICEENLKKERFFWTSLRESFKH